jgi:predicted flap endonuclease-1-like 5' DNA nuclease
MLLTGAFQEADTNTTSWVWYLLVVLLTLAVIIWWMYAQSKKQASEQSKEQEKQKPEASKAPDSHKSEESVDDMTRIEGIGPKVAKVLKEAGITSFNSLANADATEVKNKLNEAGLQMMNPEGWIEQAQLAAQEDWDGLQKLQDELKGGRRK